MTAEQKAYEGWAIVELMGHVRLAGRVSPAPMFGTELLRIDIPNGCTGWTASWCPIHGTCKCPLEDRGASNYVPTPECPLHRDDSPHGEAFTTQFASGTSLYRLTPCSEEVAAAVARESVVIPVSPWELRRLEGPRPLAGGDDFDPDPRD